MNIKTNFSRRGFAGLALSGTAAFLSACSSKKTDTPKAGSKTQDGTKKEGPFTVGICQLMQHQALDAATKGFRDQLEEKLGKDQVKFDEQNASGETANCTTIVNGFVSSGYDLIMANATPALAAAASATSDIPIVSTSITDYPSALQISADEWEGTTGTNITGTSDLAPLDKQAEIIKELFPEAQSIGLLYCTAEPNSIYQCDEIEGFLKEANYEVKRFSFNDSNDVASVTEAACGACDVIYIPTDNTAAANTEAIANVVLNKKVPVVAGEEGICSGCGVATLSIDYYELGKITGDMAYEILAEGEDISKMQVRYDENLTKKYNPTIAEQLGIKIPDGYEAIEA